MRVTGFPGRKGLLLVASLSALLLVSGCGDPQADANKRVVEAAQTLSALTEKTPAAERVIALEKAEKLLASIPTELAQTGVAVDIVAGKPVGGLRLADVREALIAARRQAIWEECQINPTEKCLADLYLETVDIPTSQSGRHFWQIIWVEYLIASERMDEAREAARNIPRPDATILSARLEGRPFVDVAKETLQQGGNPQSLPFAANHAGDKAAVATLLSDPAVIPYLDNGIAVLDLGGLSLDAPAKQRLVDQLCRKLAPTGVEDNILDKFQVSNFVRAMDKLGARDTARTFVEQLEDRWRQGLTSRRTPDGPVQDGSLLAKLYADLGLADRQSAVIATVLETAFKVPDKGVGHLIQYCEHVCPSLTDIQVTRLVDVLKRDRDGHRQAQLGLALIRADRVELGEGLLKGNEGTVDAIDLIQQLDRPQDYPRYLRMAQDIGDAEVLVHAELMRLRWAKGEDRQGAIRRLVTLIPKVTSPDQRHYLLQRALIDVPAHRDD